MNEPYRLRYANQIVGAFVLLVLLVLICVGALMYQNSREFSDSLIISTRIHESQVADLQPGADVTMLSQRVGRVTKIAYAGDGPEVDVELEIDGQYKDQITTGTTLIPARKMGVGETFLKLVRSPVSESPDSLGPAIPGTQTEDDATSAAISGASAGEGSANGHLVPSLNYQQDESEPLRAMSNQITAVAESIARIERELKVTLDSITNATEGYNESREATFAPNFERVGDASESIQRSNEALLPKAQQTLDEIKTAAHDLQKLTVSIGYLVDGDLKNTIQGTKTASDEVASAAKSFTKTNDMTRQNLNETLESVRVASKSIDELAEQSLELTGQSLQVVKVLDEEVKDLPGTTARFNDTISEAQGLVEDVRTHWLLRGSSRDRSAAPRRVPLGTIRGGQ